MHDCECEHIDHAHTGTCKNNPQVRVYTDYGWFNVCKQCAVDHLKATQSASGIWKQGDIYRG